MSNIIFQSKSAGRVLLHGSERFHLLSEIQNLARHTSVGEGPGALPGIPQLNAVMKEGRTDLAIFIVRLAAQCELTCWIDGPERAWIAAVILQGRGTGILRPEVGWEEVATMLQESDAEPVFISSSHGSLFPRLDTWPGSAEDFEQLTDEEAWQWAEQELRDESQREDDTAYLAEHPTLMAAPFSRQFRPANWQAYFFAERARY
jgi:hypothetical protein